MAGNSPNRTSLSENRNLKTARCSFAELVPGQPVDRASGSCRSAGLTAADYDTAAQEAGIGHLRSYPIVGGRLLDTESDYREAVGDQWTPTLSRSGSAAL